MSCVWRFCGEVWRGRGAWGGARGAACGAVCSGVCGAICSAARGAVCGAAQQTVASDDALGWSRGAAMAHRAS
eukprot:99642-Prymnesium_polylepis.1